MDARIAAELLYESEATLRMVDSLIDELQIGDGRALEQAQGLSILGAGQDGGAGGPLPEDVCVRGYWRVQEALDCVRDARELIASEREGSDASSGSRVRRGRVDRVHALLEAVASLDSGADPDRAALLDQLGEEIGALLEAGDARGGSTSPLGAAVTLLAEAEAGLLRVGRLFEDAGR